jgi:hypothetical protein
MPSSAPPLHSRPDPVTSSRPILKPRCPLRGLLDSDRTLTVAAAGPPAGTRRRRRAGGRRRRCRDATRAGRPGARSASGERGPCPAGSKRGAVAPDDLLDEEASSRGRSPTWAPSGASRTSTAVHSRRSSVPLRFDKHAGARCHAVLHGRGFSATQREVAPRLLARVSSVDFLLSYGLAAPAAAMLVPGTRRFSRSL